ncbi:hypothetical protein ABRQ09_08860 [Pectobacterium brasiliense]|uniref:hypothetical protein n=1 Tax=Pectobacterium brasiliense TaxID=180957 RepID=UPI0032EF8081
MAIINQIKKAATLNDLKLPKRNQDGQTLSGSVWGTDVSRTEYIEMTNGENKQMLNVGFTDRSGRPMAFGNDSHDYIQALEDSLDETFNDGEFRTAVMEHVFPCEFRPYGTNPTPIRRQALQNRTVRFKHNGAFNPAEDAPTTSAITGASVTVTPLLNPETNKTGILCSAATHVSDFDMMGGWTEGALIQTVEDMQIQYCRQMFAAVVDVLKDTPDLQVIEATPLNGKPSDQAEDLLDILALNLPVELGNTLSDYAVLVPEKLEAILERAAQRAGHEDINELLGCTVCGYAGTDTGIYLLPKRFASISFRSTKGGKTVDVKVTRNSSASGYDLELISVLDVLANGSVKVKTGEFSVEADASFPLVHAIRFSTN